MLGFGKLSKMVFGSPNDRKIKVTETIVEKINALEPEFEALSDDGLLEKTSEFKQRLEGGESLDALLPEAFANCREGAKRALGLRAFDTQLMGGIFLHEGNISEMKTGEGKTLVATFPAYLNALTGKGVHIVTAAPAHHDRAFACLKDRKARVKSTAQKRAGWFSISGRSLGLGIEIRRSR